MTPSTVTAEPPTLIPVLFYAIYYHFIYPPYNNIHGQLIPQGFSPSPNQVKTQVPYQGISLVSGGGGLPCVHKAVNYIHKVNIHSHVCRFMSTLTLCTIYKVKKIAIYINPLLWVFIAHLNAVSLIYVAVCHFYLQETCIS